ncbi:MAG: hypothetical protein QOF89_1874 [Acidobacteriota bacterium]|nr:hypothetical protein [Acidobacteriota bacterium]
MRRTTWQARFFGTLTGLALMGGWVLGAQTSSPIFSTYLGGSAFDRGNAIATNGVGSSYVVGQTRSPNFPVYRALQPLPPEDLTFPIDSFVSIFDPAGNLSYSSYFAVPIIDYPLAVTAGPGGGFYLAGVQEDLADTYAMVASFNLLTRRVFYFNLGLGSRAEARGIATDPQGRIYVTGVQFYPEPIFGALLPRAWVAKLRPDGTALYFTVLDGAGYEVGNAIAVDGQGNVYIGGETHSRDFPVRGAAQGVYGGGLNDGFVAKLDSSGAVVYATYLGGGGSDEVKDILPGEGGSVYVAGRTTSSDFPLLRARQSSLNGPADLFLAKLGPDGRLVSSTYLGGRGDETAGRIDGGPSGALYLAGSTTDTTGSALEDFAQPGCTYNFIARLDPADLGVLSSSCLPGAEIRDLAVDFLDHIHLTGQARAGLPVVRAFQPAPADGADAFVTVLQPNRPPDCSAAFASPASIWPPNGRLVPVAVRGVTDPEGDFVAITVTAVRQDEPLSRAGAPDATGIGTDGVSVRADRAGGGDGRVYRLSFTATDPQGASCTGTVAVCVPHDQGQGRTCGDGGGLFDSTAPRQ